MEGLIAATLALAFGALVGFGLARWSPNWVVVAALVLGGAAAAFWIGGELSKGEVFQMVAAFWQGLEEQGVSTTETVAALPLTAAFGFFDLVGTLGRAMFWAFSGAVLWLLGILLGSALGRQRGTA